MTGVIRLTCLLSIIVVSKGTATGLASGRWRMNKVSDLPRIHHRGHRGIAPKKRSCVAPGFSTL
jgi:hypothetical protein